MTYEVYKGVNGKFKYIVYDEGLEKKSTRFKFKTEEKAETAAKAYIRKKSKP